MRVPLSWLGEMVELRGSVEQICELLTNAGIETEIEEDQRPSWDGVVTAKLRAVEPHTGADKLTVTRPWDGTTERQVICGATNHRAGDIVALATPGTRLPGDFKIKKSKIRGELSEGMLCSETELGLGSESAGILILPADTPIGVPLSEVLEAGDVVLDVSPTANRGDCLSVFGLARELSAVTGWPLHHTGADPDSSPQSERTMSTVAIALPEDGVASGSVGKGERRVVVQQRAWGACPRYCCAVLRGVKVGPSPEWMSKRLEQAGVRSINNVVDCTNYVMLELGNPLHAFDRRFLRGDQVLIRYAQDGETARTLDGQDHALLSDDLVIADRDGVIALAGVMGGENSEVRDDSCDLFLESAHFDPDTVRRTSHRTKLNTDSSYRFARGVDPELPCAALHRLMSLILKTAGGQEDGAVLDLYPDPAPPIDVTLRIPRLRRILGLDIDGARARVLLDRLGLSASLHGAGDDQELRVRRPSYRFDIEREVDLIEEVARIEGFHAIPESRPLARLRVVPHAPAGPDLRGVRDALVQVGMCECIHFSFIDPHWLERLGLDERHPWRERSVSVANPLSEVGGVLRPTLLPSLLRGAAHNRAMGAEDLRLFELRTTFLAREGGYAEILAGRDGRPLDRPVLHETRSVAGLLIGRRHPGGWSSGQDAVDFYDLRAAVDAVTARLGAKGFAWRAAAEGDALPFLHAGEAAVLARKGKGAPVGWMGRIAVPVLRSFDLDVRVYAFELNVDALAPRRRKPAQFTKFSRFPMVERDLAVVVSDAVSAQQVLEQARKAATKKLGAAVLGVELFDVYEGEGIPAGSRSLALRFRFRAIDRTLDDKSVDVAMAQVERRLADHSGAQVRRQELGS